MSRAQCTWLDRIPLPPPHSSPSLLHPLNGSTPWNPQHGVQFGRLADQSPIRGFEPNDPVEVSSVEVMTMLSLSRRASIGSSYNSGEDIATPASSEVDERQSMGMLASPLFTQKREASATPSRIYQLKLRRCNRTKESRAEIQKVYRMSYSERERKDILRHSRSSGFS